VTPEEIKNHFKFIFAKSDEVNRVKSERKTMNFIKQMKKTQKDFKSYLDLKRSSSPPKKSKSFQAEVKPDLKI
jgi:hypothetical protein